MKNGIITKKSCPKCKKFKDISEYPATPYDKEKFYVYCEECRRDVWSEYRNGINRREHGFNGYEKIENRVQLVDDVRHLLCCLCNKLKDLGDFCGKGARCRECHTREGALYAKWWFLRKRAKTMFGELSEQFKSISNVGFRGDFKRVAEKYGFLNIKSSNSNHVWRKRNKDPLLRRNNFV